MHPPSPMAGLGLGLGLLALLPQATAFTIPQTPLGTNSNTCPLAPKVPAPNDGLDSALKFVQDATLRAQQVDRLSRAVQVPTTVNDYMTDPYDEGFAPFVEFQALLEQLFPLTHRTAKVSHINRLGLVFTLAGPSSAKPLLFTAHQDVVPINDAADWTYPPFAGHFDGEWLWGRGASDCKNVLIGLLSVVEDLLAQGWTPTRTVVLAFGFDEESHGFLGAGAIAAFLEEEFGVDAFEFVLDEGGMGLETLSSSFSSDSSSGQSEGEADNVVYALPGVSEKGSVDIILDLSVAGGHSSVPPAHTGIGMLAEIIYTLERAELFTPRLDDAHPARRKLECQVAHSPGAVEPWLAAALAANDPVALAEQLAASRGDAVRFTLQTSQAADLIHGGVKSNALPEKVSALVNYRVALHQTPAQVQDRAVRLITPIAEKHNLTLVAFPSDKEKARFIPGDNDPNAPNTLVLSTLSEPLLPAPVSPTDLSSETWARFAGVTRTVFESVPSLQGKTVVVTGDIMTGNTDTRFYWNLSRNIYRWSPSRQGGALNIHTVDERVAIDVHLEAMMLYYDLIRAFDGADSEIEHDL